MVILQRYLGIDNGYSRVKTSAGIIIPSAIKKSKGIGIGSTGYEVKIDGIDYIVTYDGTYITDSAKVNNQLNKEITRVTTLCAAYLSFKDEIESNISAQYLQIRVGVGLPGKLFKSQRDEFTNFIKSCSGRKVSVDGGREIIINFAQVYSYPQSTGLIFLEKDKFKNSDNVVVIDWGWDTVDVTTFFQGKPREGGIYTYKLGVSKLYTTLSQELMEQYGVDIDKNNIEHVVRRKYIMVDGEKQSIECLQPIIDEYVLNIRNTVNQSVPELKSSDTVFLIGGGFDAFSDNMKKFIKNAELVQNAQFVNAKAFHVVAQKMDKRNTAS